MKHYVIIWGSYSLLAVYAKDVEDARARAADWIDKTWPTEAFRSDGGINALVANAVVHELGEEPVWLGSYYD